MTPTHIKANGIVYTPLDLANFLAEVTVKHLDTTSRCIRVLDPACGDGELLVAFANAVPPRLRRRLMVTGYETEKEALHKAAARLAQCQLANVVLKHGDFLSVAESTRQRTFLVEDGPRQQDDAPGHYDAIISNPPYVRTQVLGAKAAQKLAKTFDLAGRVDLYHAFAKAMARVLEPGGVLGLLTSNRFLTIKSGASLRHFLRTAFDMRAVYDLGDTKLFSAAVLPAIVVATKQKEAVNSRTCTFERVYECRSREPQGAESEHEFASVLDAVRDGNRTGTVITSHGVFCIERGELSPSRDDSVWALSTPDASNWLAQIERHQAARFEDVGKVRVGIKTTADEVFIRDWDSMPANARPDIEWLKPLITHHNAEQWFAGSGAKTKRVLYPHTMEGSRRAPIALSDHPKTRRYLESNRERLERRKYVVDSGRKWYEIWVPHTPSEWHKDKIVYPDISEFPRFFMDTSGAIVNGDCYWITLRDGRESDWLYLMLAVANSSFILKYYDLRFHNKLYSGRRRFMTQYVNEFPLPDIASPCGKKLIRIVSAMVKHGTTNESEKAAIDDLVWESFGLIKEPAR